jgi:hypothetical protein
MVLVEALPPDWFSRGMAVLPPKSSDEPTPLAIFRLQSDLLFNDTSGQAEHLNMVASAAQAAKVTTLGDLPLVVLSRSPTKGVAEWGLATDLSARLEDAWQQAQVEQSALSTSGSLVVATKAGNVINEDEPQLVIDAILKVVEEARKRAQ